MWQLICFVFFLSVSFSFSFSFSDLVGFYNFFYANSLLLENGFALTSTNDGVSMMQEEEHRYFHFFYFSKKALQFSPLCDMTILIIIIIIIQFSKLSKKGLTLSGDAPVARKTKSSSDSKKKKKKSAAKEEQVFRLTDL